MRTHAVIIAGGNGSRMGQDIPKQFLSVNDKPIIVYTLEAFQSHAAIDSITVVCVSGWHAVLDAYARQFGITKLLGIVGGGSSSQESIKLGLDALKGAAKDGDIIVIHDGIRPLVDASVLSDAVETAARYGSAASSLPYNEQIFVVSHEVVGEHAESSTEYIPREKLRRVSTPQAYRWPDIIDVYDEAFRTGDGIGGSNYANTIWVSQGRKLHLSKGSDRNLKLTTKDDLEMFKAWLNVEETLWLK